jgi:hypothetical protein
LTTKIKPWTTLCPRLIFLRNTLASQKNFAASGLLRTSIAQALFFRPEASRKRSDPTDGNPPLSPLCLNILVAWKNRFSS